MSETAFCFYDRKYKIRVKIILFRILLDKLTVFQRI